MGQIIHMSGDDHLETQALMPWYVNGRLESEELATVEAHLAECAECRADLRLQRRLQTEVAQLPMDIEQGWADMRRRLVAETPELDAPAAAQPRRQRSR